MKSYLSRGLITLALWLLFIGLLLPWPKVAPVYPTIPLIILTVVLGKVLLQAFTQATGLIFFMTGTGIMIFYTLVFITAPFTAPIYAAFCLVRHFIGHGEPPTE